MGIQIRGKDKVEEIIQNKKIKKERKTTRKNLVPRKSDLGDLTCKYRHFRKKI